MAFKVLTKPVYIKADIQAKLYALFFPTYMNNLKKAYVLGEELSVMF